MPLHPDRRRRPPFLVVEHDPKLARDLTIFLGRHAPTVLAASLADARYAVADHDRWSGVVAEMRMPDGSGLDLLQVLRRTHSGLHGLVLTGLHDPSLFQMSSDAETMFSPRPPEQRTLAAFVVTALGLDSPETRRSSAPPGVPSMTPPSAGSGPGPKPKRDVRTLPELGPGDVPFMTRAAAVRDEAMASGLSTREMQVLGLVAEGREPVDTVRALGMDSDAYEAHLRRILAKTRSRNIDELVQRILFDARLRAEAKK
jgi:FixJ family two-component response regulator